MPWSPSGRQDWSKSERQFPYIFVCCFSLAWFSHDLTINLFHKYLHSLFNLLLHQCWSKPLVPKQCQMLTKFAERFRDYLKWYQNIWGTFMNHIILWYYHRIKDIIDDLQMPPIPVSHIQLVDLFTNKPNLVLLFLLSLLVPDLQKKAKVAPRMTWQATRHSTHVPSALLLLSQEHPLFICDHFYNQLLFYYLDLQHAQPRAQTQHLVLSSSEASFPINAGRFSHCACVSVSLRRRSQERLGSGEASSSRAGEPGWSSCSGTEKLPRSPKWALGWWSKQWKKQAAPFLRWSHPLSGTYGPDR